MIRLAGATIAVVAPPDAYAYASRFAAHRAPLPRRGGALLGRLLVRGRRERLVRDWSPDRIIPLDDLAARVVPGTLSGQEPSGVRRGLDTGRRYPK